MNRPEHDIDAWLEHLGQAPAKEAAFLVEGADGRYLGAKNLGPARGAVICVTLPTMETRSVELGVREVRKLQKWLTENCGEDLV